MPADTPVARRMAEYVQRWEQAGDRRVVFLACYALMTDNMLTALQSGRFHDQTWVTALVDNFADYYFVALDAYEQRQASLPIVWDRAHTLAASPATTVIQNLLLGINAHINHDLVLVLADMLQPEWDSLGPEQRQLRFADHCKVNTIIGETIDAVQDQVVERYARAMDVVDKLCGPLDEWGTARLIRYWRNDVWRQAVAIIETPDPAARLELRRQVDAAALQRVRLLLAGGELGARAFGYPLRWLHRLRLL